MFAKLKQVKSNVRRVKLNHAVFVAFLVAFVWVCWGGLDSAPTFVPKELRKYLLFPEGFKLIEKKLNESELTKLMHKVEKLNTRVEVINWDKYNPVNSETTIIVINVHKDVERLQYLIISLGQVYSIHQVLLVFSHSYFDDVINSLIRSIDFCKVMQIFYPFSLQLYPNKFPGVDPDDCNVTLAPKIKGRGKTPIVFSPPRNNCFERDARRTQHKQHWWWTANYVFEELAWSSNKQVTIFLEEDTYVLPDLLHMLQYAQRVLPYFPTVEVMSFGRPYAENLDYDLLLIDAWTPPFEKGLAFNKTTWRKIVAKSTFYCFYDDCSWSYSLVNLFANFTGGIVEMAACAAPRVLSTGVLASGRRAASWVGRECLRAELFPAHVRTSVTVGASGRVRRAWRMPPRGNGGWADLRDHMLCLDPLMTTTTELTTEISPVLKHRIKNDSYE